MKVIYCLFPKEDSKGVFYILATIRSGGEGHSTYFEQKPTHEQVADYLQGVYPEAVEFVWHIDYSQTPEEILPLYFSTANQKTQ
jgi:hypothetical protein